MIVMKFGGTSVGSAKAIREAVAIVQAHARRNPVVVVSAVAGTTNELIAIALEKSITKRAKLVDALIQKHSEITSELGLDARLLDDLYKALIKEASKKEKWTPELNDLFVSFGERMSARIVARVLSGNGVEAQAFDAWDIGMITDDNHGAAEPLKTSAKKMHQKIEKLEVVPVVTGFIGKSAKGKITTLGRGGSDYSAALIGAAVKANEIQIWKEVDGILTTDPRLVPQARIVPELAFEEAAELAYFGAKVLHPKAIIPAMIAGVPVKVLNTFNPEGQGTTIVASFAERKEKSETVEALTFKKNVIAVHVLSPEFFDNNGLMARLFEIFDRNKTSIDMVATSVASVSVTIDNDAHLKQIEKELKTLGTVVIERENAVVCAVGGSVNAAGVAGKMFQALGAASIPVEMISQAATGVSITFMVDEKNAIEALKVLHAEFIEA